MLFITNFVALAIVPLMAGAALIMRARRPDRSNGAILNRVLAWALSGAFLLMAAGCSLTMASDCPAQDTVCDTPAMAAAGIVMIGVLLIGLVFFVGGPVAYLALRLAERK